MAGAFDGLSRFLDLSPPEDSPPGDSSPVRVERYNPTAKGRDRNDSSDSDVGGHGGEDNRLYGACLPVAGGQGLATHVVLQVNKVTNISRNEVARTHLPPGRISMAHFLDDTAPTYQLCTMSIVHFNEVPPYGMKPRRCCNPRAQLLDPEPPRKHEAYWEGQNGEVRVRLRNNETGVMCGLVVGGEVIGVTRLLSLYGATRRFFQEYEIYRPGGGVSGISEMIGLARIRLELWPYGSVMPQEFDSGLGTDADIGLVQIGSSRAGPGLLPEGPSRSADLFQSVGDGVGSGGGTGGAPCNICDGLGRRPCAGCQGHGALVCVACDGMPPLPCGNCNGKGVVEGGLETIAGTRGGTLSSAGGKRCMVCWGSPITCETCFGVGALRCSTCGGAGWTQCVCGSTGKMWV